MAPAILFNPSGPELLRHDGVMNGRVRPYRMSGYEGNLSIKCMVQGAATWETQASRHVVDARTFLVLNEGRRYSLTVGRDEAIETFCAFFTPRLVADIRRSLADDPARLLDDPLALGPQPRVAEHLRPHAPPLLAALRALHAALRGGADDTVLEDIFHTLGRRLILHCADERLAPDRLASARRATREELYRRLCRARDALHAAPGEALPLARLARIAALSPAHFHRSFQAAFGQTPRGYLAGLRLDRAADLLCNSDRPILQIAAEVGLASVGSFTSAFGRRFGAPPGRFRALRRPRRAWSDDSQA